jgi:ABC-type glycerol-3-phosphate transport system permease component
MRVSLVQGVKSVLIWAAIVLIVIWVLSPFAWAILTTFKSGTSVYNNQWIPWLQFDPSLSSWRSLFRLPVLKEALATSAAVSIAVATLAVLLAAPASYSVARMRWSARWQAGLLFGFLGQRIMLPVVLITPYMLLSARLGLRDTMQGLVVINVTFMLPLAVIVIHGAFASMPPELIEAASLDGANAFRTFVQIAIPLAGSAVVAAWVLCLAFTWNEWLYADFMTFERVETMPVALIAVVGGGSGANVPSAMARALSMMVVPIAAALATQRFIASGLSMGAVKA